MKLHRFASALRGPLVWGLVLAAMLGTQSLGAQTSTGSIRGTVTSADGLPMAEANIIATNIANGVTRSTTSRMDGTYVLPGMVPAVYTLAVRSVGSGAQERRVVVQIGATQIQNFALTAVAVQLQEIVALGAAAAFETRTSELATNVTTAQLEKLPTPSRNFLDLAALAPGITVTEDRINGNFRTFSAGGQSANAVNVFIDGTSLKNDLTAGGVAGQDASRGSPFPRSAIQEYRVISPELQGGVPEGVERHHHGDDEVRWQHAGAVPR